MRLLLSLVRPLSSIARELRLLRELYELDLSSRTPPVIRRTEEPREKDTEVLYSGMKDDRPVWKRWLDPQPDDSNSEDEQD